MKIGEKGLALIKEAEGLRLEAYLCPAGVWTIGYGHTGEVRKDDKITLEHAEELLRKDVSFAEGCLNRHGLDLNQNQFDALCSFIYNLGCTNFNSSTLLRWIRGKASDKEIAAQFRRWVYAKGEKSEGLKKRREKEIALFFEK